MAAAQTEFAVSIWPRELGLMGDDGYKVDTTIQPDEWSSFSSAGLIYVLVWQFKEVYPILWTKKQNWSIQIILAMCDGPFNTETG